ncbi:uncharacterized protein LOC124932730 isoform X2 [Impatiens glandulifera]|uniref:uncharacterized protein LOC124932730 isoform X2 n=1 Tax=Impatiens glandulifera TaxID=253017 RepID=UPI001FB167E1|nr:uncharacterized protein LOC124932730 isoform X2 [Impatiens glandulifera]XP_047329359.1 uncharacterized protein LOC124932730 isoform X2 [Impatiens glandulifera]XP_047329360.1 uncharacterized protein LOC124932730 isoform X2 [Impatiens glandulifera]
MHRTSFHPQLEHTMKLILIVRKIASSPVVEGQTLADSSTKTEVPKNQDSISKEAAQNEKTCEPTFYEKSSKVVELVENQCKQGSATSCTRQSEVGSLEQSGQKGESPMLMSEDILPDSSGLSKSKHMKLTDLPRRTSKRLAGIQIHQPLEIKTKNETRSSLASHLGEVVGNVGELVKKTETDIIEQMQLDPKKHTDSRRDPAIIGNVEESVGKIESEDTTKKQKMIETENNIKKKSNQKPTDWPRRISKRLAGIDIVPQLEHKIPTHPRRISAEPLHESKDCLAENVINTGQVQEESSTVVVSAETNQFIPPGADKTVEEETKLPVEVLLSEIWMDPCFEFAVKTLTGDIPIEDHLKLDKIPQPSTITTPPFSKCPWEDDPCFEFAVKTLTGDIEIEDYPREFQTRIGGDRDSDSRAPPTDSTRNDGALQGQLNNKRKKST